MRVGLRPGRIAIAIGALAILVAVGIRFQFERRKPLPSPPSSTLLDRVREQLALAPVLAAEAVVRARPGDVGARMRLAEACAATGDPVGAALALRPNLPTPPAFVRACVQVGWREEAAAALGPAPARRVREALELAAAWVEHGERERATALLAAIEAGDTTRVTPNDWLNGAMTWYQSREPQRAGRWAERAVRAAGADPAMVDGARMVWARCLLAAKDMAGARAVLAEGPATELSFEYLEDRVELRAGSGERLSRARRRIAEIGMGDPPDPVAAFEAGRALLQEGQAAEAVRLLSRAAQHSYQEALAYDLLARAEAASGRPAAAAWAAGRVAILRGRLAEAERQLQRSIQLGASRAGVYLDLARALSLAGKSKAAVDLLRGARQRLPNDPQPAAGVDRSTRLDLALAEADALNQQDRFEEQARVLEAAVAPDPSRAHEPLRNLGRMYYETRQFDRVIPVLERAVALKETDAASHRFLGLCYALRPEERAQAERALTHLLRATALEPAESAQWTNAGAVLERMGHLPEAAACYRRAIGAVSWVEGPYLALARSLQREGRREEAAFLLRLARTRRDLQARRTELENRVGADRGDAEAHLALGDLLFRTEGYRNAFPYLLIAASLRPTWRQAQLRLADACALLDYVDMWQEAERAAKDQ